MELCTDSDELDIFNEQIIKDLIQFKWDAYARTFHYFGAIMHFQYLVTIIVYVYLVYVYNALGESGNIFTIMLGVGISYPAMYDTT